MAFLERIDYNGRNNCEVKMISIFGAAGSGKSTQGKLLADKYGWKWLSVGEVLRGTGRFDEILQKGELVDDAVVVELMREEIAKANDEGMDVIVDGFPRDEEQAEMIFASRGGEDSGVSGAPGASDEIDENSELDERGELEEIEVAIVLDVTKEELLRRIFERGRVDDTEEAVERRIGIFEENIVKILPILEEHEVKIVHLNGMGTIKEVSERIEAEVRKVKPDMVEVFNDEDKDVIENDTVVREGSYGE
jgi:adenylate kinase